MKNTQTQQMYVDCKNKGRKVLYLVLKKKSFEKEIIEKIEKELEVKLKDFLKDIEPKIRNVEFEDPENSLKVIFLEGLINILQELLQKSIGKLSKDDKKILDEIVYKDDKFQNPSDKKKR